MEKDSISEIRNSIGNSFGFVDSDPGLWKGLWKSRFGSRDYLWYWAVENFIKIKRKKSER